MATLLNTHHEGYEGLATSAGLNRRHHFVAQRGGDLGLRLVVRHQASDLQLFHRGEVQSVQRPNVGPLGGTMLLQCGLEEGPGQGAERERFLVSSR